MIDTNLRSSHAQGCNDWQSGGDVPPHDFRGKSWQVLDFCWQVLENLESWQVVDFLLAGFGKFEKLLVLCFQCLEAGSIGITKL